MSFLNRLFGKPKPAPVNMFEPVNKFLATYDSGLYSGAAAQSAPDTEDAIADFERLIGYSLPADFRLFTKSPYCGLCLRVKPEIWPLPEPYQIGPAWSFQRGLFLYGLSPVLPAENNLRYWHEYMFMQHRIDNLLPFMAREGLREKYCFTSAGEIVLWDPSTPDRHEKVQASFVELLAKELYALDERRQRKQRGEDLPKD